MRGRYAQRRGRLRSPLPPNNGRDGRLLFFQTAGKFSTLVAPIVILTEADKRCEVVLISKKGCLRLDSIKKKNDKRCAWRTDRERCVAFRPKYLNFPAGNLRAFIHFTLSIVETGRKGPFRHDRCGLGVSHCPVRAQ